MNGLVTLDGVTCAYGADAVLRDVSLVIGEHQLTGVVGPSGSGKTTLLKVLLGTVLPRCGAVARQANLRIGYVPQRLTAGGGVPATVREVVLSGRIARQRRWRRTSPEDKAAVADALAAMNLTDRANDPVHALSGGQQQRVLIARALAGQPDVFVMDEPTAGVDAASQRALADIPGAAQHQGKGFLLGNVIILGACSNLSP